MSGVGGRATVMCDSNNPLVFPQMCAIQRDLDELIGYCKYISSHHLFSYPFFGVGAVFLAGCPALSGSNIVLYYVLLSPSRISRTFL